MTELDKHSGRKYKPVADGEWVQPTPKGYRMACCDCGLVHALDFRVIKYASGKRAKVQFRARRDVRATAGKRRNRKAIRLRPYHSAGEGNPKAKLSKRQVAVIRASQATAPALAHKYGVHRNTIYRILSGKQWAKA